MGQFPSRILFAADGSQASDLARSHLIDLLAAGAAELHVLHVGLVSPWTNPRTLNPDQYELLRAAGQQVLDRQINDLAAAGVAPAQTHLRMGRATDEVLRIRDLIEADLIVIGSRGMNAFARVLLGNDAESIVRHAPCSVLVVREDR